MKQTKKILITGGAGFIGSNLIERLLQEDSDIHLILRKNTDKWRIKHNLNRIHKYAVPLSEKKKLKILLEKIKPDIIFHLAAYGNYSWHAGAAKMIRTNITELENLLEASKEIDYKIFVNTGSSTEYGISKGEIKETEALKPESFYGVTKASGTLLCQAFARIYEKPIVTLRLFSVYGKYEEEARLIPAVIKALNDSREVSITKEKVKRDFIYVDDVVDAYIAAAKHPYIGEIFNVGTGKQYSNNQIVKFLGKIHGSIKISHIPYPVRRWDTDSCVASTQKSKKMLHWSAKYDIKIGLRKTYSWFKKNESLYIDGKI